MNPESYPLFGAVAVESGVLSEEELAAAVEQAEARGLPLGQMMYKLGYVSRDRILELLAEQYRTSVFDLADWRADPTLLTALPEDVVVEMQVLPIQWTPERLVVAASGPFARPVVEMLQELANMTDRGVGMVICDEEGLRRILSEHFGASADTPVETEASGEGLDDFSSLLDEVKADAVAGGEQSGATAGAELDDLVDEASAAAIQVRAHPFVAAIQQQFDVATDLLNKARQYQHMGLFGEGIALAKRSRDQLLSAIEKADDVEKQWGPLLRHVEVLRSRFAQLDAEGAADFAAQEIGRSREIRDELADCIDNKQVDQLRALVDEGQLLVERIAALSPRHNRRERLVESLTHVRDVLSRARKLGAQSIAPEAVEAAYRLLDDADTQARESAWDQVEDSLAQALAHAEAAEREALEYAEQRQVAVAELVGLCDEVEATTTSLFNHASVSSILTDLVTARADMSRARMAIDNEDDLTPHIAVLSRWAKQTLPELREQGDAAGRSWEVVATELQSIVDMTREAAPAAMDPDQAEMVQRLADRVGTLFRLLSDRNLSDARAVIEVTQGELRDFWDLRERSSLEREQAEARLLAMSTELATVAGHPDAGACQELIERVQNDLDLASTTLASGNFGDSVSLLDSAEATLNDELRPALESRNAAVVDVLERTLTLAPKLVSLAEDAAASTAPSEFGAVATALQDAVRAIDTRDISSAEAALEAAATREAAARRIAETANATRREQVAKQLAATEKLLQDAVEACTGYAAPDILEDAYLELNSARTALEEYGDNVDALAAAAIDGKLRVAAQTAKMLTSAGGRDALKFGQAVETLQARVEVVEEAVQTLRSEPTFGLDTTSLDEATECGTEARAAFERGEVDDCYEQLRMTDRALERWRAARSAAEAARPEQDAFFAALPDRLAQLDESLLPDAAHAPLAELRQLPDAAAAAMQADDLQTLQNTFDRAQTLWAMCTETERSERSRRLVDMHEARAVAYHAVRLAQLVGSEELASDLFNAASELLSAGEADVEQRKWDQAQVQFAAAADRAALAQEAALRSSRDAWLAQADLTSAAFAHLDRGDVEAARSALDAAASSATRARPPVSFPPMSGFPPIDTSADDESEDEEDEPSDQAGPAVEPIQWESAEDGQAAHTATPRHDATVPDDA